MYVIGIDVGTTGTKSAVVDAFGNVIGKGYREYALHTAPGGIVEQNAEDWWDAVAASVKEAVAAVPDKTAIQAISLSTQGGSTFAADGQCNPISPAYTWMDMRAARENEEICAEPGCADYIYRTGGWRSAPIFDPAKLRHMSRHDEGVFSRAAYFLSTAEFVQVRLTGRLAIDPTNAAMRQLYSVPDGRWDPRLLSLAGITEDRLPPLLPAGAYLGTLTKATAEALGLPDTVKVYNGAHDQYCASLGSGAVSSGDMLLSTGTTWVVLGVTRTPLFTDTYLSPCRHPAAGLYGNIASLQSAGSALKWLAGVTGKDFKEIDAMAETRRHTAAPILYYPYYAGAGFPHHRDEVKACCIGMELMHDGYDLARALMEGTAFETRRVLEEFARRKEPVKRLKMVGGAAKSALWRRITCDVTECELVLPAEADTCCIGAAILAAVGCGIYPHLRAATDAMVHYSASLSPDPESVDFYREKYARYQKNLPNVMACFE